MKRLTTVLIGVLIMMDIAMMAGCASSSGTDKPVAEETKEEKIILNDDGIAIYAPKSALTFIAGDNYGKMEHTGYYSKIAEKNKNINVLLPPNYTTEKKYPVLYVLHGIFGDENSMTGSATNGNRVTFCNLMNKGLAEEMIIVFPFMYTSKTQAQCTAIDDKNVACYDNFIDELTTSIMPYIAEKYSVKEGRENTAITGFSMGGRESLACAFYRPDLFKYVGAMCPAPGLVYGKDFAMEHKGQFKEQDLVFDAEKAHPDLLMICAGDCDSVVGTFPMTYHAVLTKNNTEHLWWIVPGSDHGDPAVSSGLYNFMIRLFK